MLLIIETIWWCDSISGKNYSHISIEKPNTRHIFWSNFLFIFSRNIARSFFSNTCNKTQNKSLEFHFLNQNIKFTLICSNFIVIKLLTGMTKREQIRLFDWFTYLIAINYANFFIHFNALQLIIESSYPYANVLVLYSFRILLNAMPRLWI